MTKWSLDLEKYCKQKKESIKKVRRKIAWKIFDGVVKKTPVDTGRARGNWQISVGKDETGQLDRLDSGQLGSPAQNGTAEAGKLEKVNGDEPIFISNNLPYITTLEYGGYSKKSKTGKTVNGFSKQAPQGMVGLTMANVQKFVKDAIKESEEGK